jgi:hypothetical protein
LCRRRTSFPTIASFKNGDDPSTRQLDIAAEFSKRITDNFGISLALRLDATQSVR